MQITIEENVSLDDIDNYYGRLARFADVDANVDLLLPIRLENNFMGLVPSLIQFTITWIRYNYAGKLLLNVTNSPQQDWNSFLENEHLFPLIVLSWNKAGVYDASGKTNIKQYLKEPIAEFRKRMIKVKPIKGWKLLLTSVDHFPISSGLLPSVETPSGFINNEMNTFRNISPALNEILKYSFSAKTAYEAHERDFIGIIHELLKNTHEWGKTDSDNVPVDPGIRGLLVKFYKKRRETFIEEFSMHKGLSDYFKSPELKENASTELYFLEISVYDSGVGFVDKYSAKDKENLNEVDIIKRCLILHMSSAKGLEKDDKGVGLDRILQLLDKKGFLRIKTHNACLYRNLISHPYQLVDNEKNLELFDWKTQSNASYTILPKAAGSILTILYPLALNSTE